MDKKCPNCGAKVSENQKQCEYCGTIFSASKTTDTNFRQPKSIDTHPKIKACNIVFFITLAISAVYLYNLIEFASASSEAFFSLIFLFNLAFGGFYLVPIIGFNVATIILSVKAMKSEEQDIKKPAKSIFIASLIIAVTIFVFIALPIFMI